VDDALSSSKLSFDSRRKLLGLVDQLPSKLAAPIEVSHSRIPKWRNPPDWDPKKDSELQYTGPRRFS
jgi:hypothetical protein